MSDFICGIDLGTTNSSIAYLQNGEPIAIPIEEGSALVPSIVSLDAEENRIIVGRQAKNRLAAYPDWTIRSVKRLMGREQALTLGSQSFSPEEISSFILNYLVFNAGKVIGAEIKKVVITVPAYFNDAQRRATIRAGELAGLEVVRIVNEPTAASLVYDYVSFQKEAATPYVMVYDLGGGTFDVSILEVKGDIKEVLASCGDTTLGGDDFDARLTDFFIKHLNEMVSKDLVIDTMAQVRLRDLAEKTKIKLSDQPFVKLAEASVLLVQGEPVNLNLEIARRDFENMVQDLVEKTVEKVDDALKEAHLLPEDIGKILLVGGATRMPIVQRLLSEMFARPIYHSLDPDLCVALGAAVQGGLISGEPLGHILLDVTAHSLGLKTIDEIDPETGDADYFATIIRRNTKIPVRKTEVFYSMVDDQARIDIEVYQGEKLSCKENVRIGNFLYDLKEAPAHSPITVEFSYDKEGIIHVVVDQKGYDNHKEVTIDIRKKKVIDQAQEVKEQQLINYIIEKARRLLSDADLSDEVYGKLTELTDRYEQALIQGEDDVLIDDLEDKLLAKIEEIEERTTDLE